jgi:hypothetical protein
MSPRILQQKIHSTFSTNAAVWEDFRTEITDLYNATTNRVDFNNHLLREFNKKVRDLNLSSDLYFTPFDGGLRFIGVNIDEGATYFRPDGVSVYKRPDGTSIYNRP